jgi:hypothetical protein
MMRKVKLLFQLNGYLHGLTLGKKSSTCLFQINILRRVRTLLLLFLTNFCFAQSDSTQALNLSAYAEGYFSYDFSKLKNKLAARLEYYHDAHQITMSSNLLWRSEIKMNQSKEVIFDGGNGNYAFTTSFCIKI